MKLISTLIIFLFHLSLFSQNIAEGTIKDLETKNPIPYVNVGIIKKNIGTVSDSNGKFDFEIPKAFQNDSIKISSIGYRPKSMLVKDFLSNLKTNPVVELVPEITELNEVVVTSKKMKEKIVGNKTKSGKFRGGFRNATLGHEVGIKIKIKDSPTYIKKFHANVTSNTSETMKFRMNFYNVKNGLPNEKIVKENIIFPINVKEGEFTLNLEKYNIVVEEDFYCTIELVENQKSEDEIFFSAGFLGNTMAFRLTSQGEWDKSGTVGVGFNYTVKY
ncbi:carboxypeptidase-like regulatory domain-containing protein [Cellulophaga sp. L1A9]|uniref:carboxypeptidase-like regulatory domain-containing protein n=1 Tax=Cellulophaga sp. L1A9 TaxID=2686362 RepID=UPI00131D3564|nr:carboxypeptidase-like regulatory domain-containing protein [Cellulophaga sp. L1A9]